MNPFLILAAVWVAAIGLGLGPRPRRSRDEQRLWRDED